MRAEEMMCGGTSRSRDENAPKAIESNIITLFNAASSFTTLANGDFPQSEANWINYISAFAAKIGSGSFLSFEARDRGDRRESGLAFVKEDVFPKLVQLVNKAGFVKWNGNHSFTHGLPENFGGEVNIRYESGEKISFSDNQSPVFGKDVGIEIYELFSRAVKADKAPVPDAGKIIGIKIYEENSSGYTRSELTKNSDGSYTRTKVYKFEDPRISEYTDTVSAEVMERIRNIAGRNYMLLWDSFPRREFGLPWKKTMTFILCDGSEAVVTDDRVLPPGLSSAFFAVEQELS